MTSILIACLAKKIKYVYLYFMNLMHECEGGVCTLISKKINNFEQYLHFAPIS
jgi:hypothetical protein